LCSLQTLEEYCGKYKEEGEEFKTLINGVLPEGWADELPTFTEKDKGIATRLHSQTMLNALAPILPGFWGGSAGMSLFCKKCCALFIWPCGCRAGLLAAHMLWVCLVTASGLVVSPCQRFAAVSLSGLHVCGHAGLNSSVETWWHQPVSAMFPIQHAQKT